MDKQIKSMLNIISIKENIDKKSLMRLYRKFIRENSYFDES